MGGDKLKDFNTSKWPINLWPKEAVPIQGYILPSSLRPRSPAFPDKPYMETAVSFERVVISLTHFQESCIEMTLRNADKDRLAYQHLLYLIAFAFSGPSSITRQVENSRKFSTYKIKKMRFQGTKVSPDSINFRAPPNGWSKLSDEELWTSLIPTFIAEAFLPSATVSITDTDIAKIIHELSEIIGPYLAHEKGGNQIFDSAQRAFERALNNGQIQDSSLKGAILGWRFLQQELETSIKCFIASKPFGHMSQNLVSRDATVRYLNFWYTSDNPWKQGLRGSTPALGESIPSIYSELNPSLQDEFDKYVFIRGEIPPREVLKSLLIFTKTHVETVDKIRQAENNNKRNNREAKNLHVKDQMFHHQILDAPQIGSSDWHPRDDK
jgi:hypothetical protein